MRPSPRLRAYRGRRVAAGGCRAEGTVSPARHPVGRRDHLSHDAYVMNARRCGRFVVSVSKQSVTASKQSGRSSYSRVSVSLQRVSVSSQRRFARKQSGAVSCLCRSDSQQCVPTWKQSGEASLHRRGVSLHGVSACLHRVSADNPSRAASLSRGIAGKHCRSVSDLRRCPRFRGRRSGRSRPRGFFSVG